MKFVSKPMEIDAFQFTGKDVKPPKWFIHSVTTGKASVTFGAKETYITLYDGNDIRRAYLNEWICQNETGRIFSLTKEEIDVLYSKAG